MQHGEYLLLLGSCLLLTLPLEFVFRARVYRRPLLTLRVIGVILILFGTWDLIAYRRGHWSYDPQYFLGISAPGGLPLEEILFFVVIPLCALLTYGAVGTCLGWLRRLRRTAGRPESARRGAARADPGEQAHA
ncbi:lycopene cyclase domain-containing protein [Amycolatopsis sp. H6(2020)]|nr:lycopene cyclase domain-containing protein [Amycolatopsis sp. H6(2020)]